MKRIVLLGLMVSALFSCVPLKQFDDIKKDAQLVKDQNQLLKEKNRELTVENNEMSAKIASFQKKLQELEQSWIITKDRSKTLVQENQRLKQQQSELNKQIEALKEGSSEEITSLMNDLQKLQSSLQEREDLVKRAEEKINAQEKALQNAQTELANQQEMLNQAQGELVNQQTRMMELQDALDKQKNAVAELKNKLNNALRGFYDQGLSVYERNGKVYVSLEENLMFRTGSYNLDPRGQEALKSLAEVLANNPDINVMVEGHTDNVPLNGAGVIKDNWDLSVMRATAVTRILLQNTSIEPERIIAAGRSEYVPLDNSETTEGRRKNRRTEIILTPDLSEVLDIIQSN